MRRHLGKLVFALGIGFTAAAMFNVYSDNAEVERDALLRACGDSPPGVCRTQLTRFERTPFSQKFTVQVAKDKTTKDTETVQIKCTRSAVFVGPYSCAR